VILDVNIPHYNQEVSFRLAVYVISSIIS